METKTVIARGTTISYIEATSDNASREVLYIHGNTGCNLWFEKVMEQPGCRVVAPDMPNFGLSGHLETADIDLYADIVAEFIQEVGLREPVVVGHSLGGGVAMSLAIRFPEVAAALVLVDSCAPGGLHTPEEHYPAIELYKSNSDFLMQGLAAVTPEMKDPELLQRLVERAMRMNPIAFEGNARALDRFSVEGKTQTYRKPVLVIHGEKDIIITRDMAEETAAAFPAGRLEPVEGIGHSIMVEDPAGFSERLQRFLGEVS